MADANSVSNDINGVDGNGNKLPWRVVHLLRPAQIGDLASQTDGDAEVANVSSSVYDQIVTLAKVLTRTYRGADIFDMVATLYQAHLDAVAATTPAAPATPAS